MKSIIFVLFVMVMLMMVTGCNCQQAQYMPQTNQQNQTISTSMLPGVAGLDLQALTALTKTASSAGDLEAKLNMPGSINNLDLDNDGQVDYVHVTEYFTNGIRGFSFTVMDASNNKQELATIEFQNSGNVVNTTIIGNQYMYGPNQYYTSSWSTTDFLLWSYFLRPHSIYYSPYHYGYYPPSYHYYRLRPYDDYSRHVTQYNTTVIKKTTIVNRRSYSPNERYSNSTISRSARPTVVTRSNPFYQKTNPYRSYSPSNTGTSNRSYTPFNSGNNSGSNRSYTPRSNSGSSNRSYTPRSSGSGSSRSGGRR